MFIFVWCSRLQHGPDKVVEELVDEGERVAALLCDLMEHMIVDTQAEPAILLFHE
jgi:hypothetical protein